MNRNITTHPSWNIWHFFNMLKVEDAFINWIRRNAKRKISEICFHKLIQERNESCSIRLFYAEWLGQFHRELKIIKFVPEYFELSKMGFFVEPNSPYVDTFYRIHQQTKQSDLISKWKFADKNFQKQHQDENH